MKEAERLKMSLATRRQEAEEIKARGITSKGGTERKRRELICQEEGRGKTEITNLDKER